MVIDAAKGIETQTKKLFRVCSVRGIPIMTFVNKMDRRGREPLSQSRPKRPRLLGGRSAVGQVVATQS